MQASACPPQPLFATTSLESTCTHRARSQHKSSNTTWRVAIAATLPAYTVLDLHRTTIHKPKNPVCECNGLCVRCQYMLCALVCNSSSVRSRAASSTPQLIAGVFPQVPYCSLTQSASRCTAKSIGRLVCILPCCRCWIF